MDNGSCETCKSSFIKPDAKFCNKCGAKRIGPHKSKQPTKKVMPTIQPLQISPIKDIRPSTSIGTSCATGRIPNGAKIKDIEVSLAQTTKPMTSRGPIGKRRSLSKATEQNGSNDAISTDEMDMMTLEPDEEDEAKIKAVMSTLGPDGLTPEMLETSNAEELRQYKRGGLLGRGTYGAVYLGLLPDGSFHAVKSVELGGKTGGITLKELVSLSREITMMRRLVHKNLCK
eukprot:Tbor_TRINITY_DN1973_c0_g1::TRINITY_DN1973_c0_g1_i1::g.3545::m.3545